MKKLLGLAAILGAVYYFGKNKAKDFKVFYKNLKISLLGLSNIGWKNGKITLDVSLKFANNSDVDFSLSTGGALTLNRIFFYSKAGEKLGVANLNMSHIEIPANGSLILKNIPATVPITEIEDFFGTALSIFSNIDNLKIKLEITALGKTSIVEL